MIVGAIFVTLIHELGHFLSRLNCATRREVKNTFTPEFPGKTRLIEDYVPGLQKKNFPKGEAGFKLESSIFGQIVQNITEEGTRVLLGVSHYYRLRIKDFRNAFLQANNDSLGVNLSRGSKIFVGLKCGVRDLYI